MRTVVRGEQSDFMNVKSGVPQGSVLGPLLFVLFINDLPNEIKNISKIFADDLKIVVNAAEHHDNCVDLRSLEIWEETWLLKFNIDKCKVMHIDMNNNPKNDYVLDNSILKETYSEMDLGILMNEKLAWKSNIDKCIKDANRTIAWVSRNVIAKDIDVMLRIYKALVRPKLEYCVQLWNPTAHHGNWATILELEGVQRRFTRLINGIGTLPYSERLDRLKITTLAERRIRGDLIETFKILNNKVSYGQNLFKLGSSRRNLLTYRKSNTNLSKEVGKINDNFISERVKPYWNNLPKFVRDVSDVDMFKASLEQYKCNTQNLCPNNFWYISTVVLEKIEGDSYLSNKTKFNEYLRNNPFVAKKKGINIFS